MAGPTRSSCMAARETRAIASPPTGMRSGIAIAAVSVPVIGNGDLLFPHEIERARARSGCAAVMGARGALIKPWIFRETSDGYGTSPPTNGSRSIGATPRSPASIGATTSTA